MNVPVTRRALLGATAAVGAVGLPIAVAAETEIPASDLDAELHGLLDRWHEARAAWDATDALFGEALSRAEAAYPPRSDALLWQESDFPRTSLGLGLSTPVEDIGGAERREYQTRGIGWLRDRPAASWFATIDPPLGPECEARRLEILAAHDRWQADCRAVDDATGYTTAVEAEEAAARTFDDADDALEEYQPRTVHGLVRKAAWVLERVAMSSGESDLGEVFAHQVAAFGGAAT